ncbi:YIP1 family protein [Rhodobacteraceae bacterium]|nr:YIP1 family protein [Paracoccaceae bacterium]
MSVLEDILRSYRAPRHVVRGYLAQPRSEPQAFGLLLAALAFVFIAQWPGLSRFAINHADTPLFALLLGQAFGLLLAVPVLYVAAQIAHWVAKPFGGRGSAYRSRIALFWALLAVSPVLLLRGLLYGLIGPSPQLTIANILIFVIFLVIWLAGLRVAEFETEEPPR